MVGTKTAAGARPGRPAARPTSHRAPRWRRSLIASIAWLAACVTSTPPDDLRPGPATTTVSTFDAAGNPTDGAPFGIYPGGVPAPAPVLPPPGNDAFPDGTVPSRAGQDAQDTEAERRRQEALIRTTFGDAVMIGADGRVTKQYLLSGESGHVFLSLLAPLGRPRGEVPPPGTRIGGEQMDSVLGRMLGASNEVEIVYIPDFVAVDDMPVPPKPELRPKPERAPTSSSLVLATAKASALSAFELALNLFYANIPQVEIEVKVVEYSTSDSLSFGVSPLDKNTPTFQNLQSGRLVRDLTSSFPLTAPFIGNTTISDQGLITLGGIHDSWELNAVVQLLETKNIADVLSRPRMVVRNGGMATIATKIAQPFPKAKISNQTTVATDIEFKDVGIVMHIRPEIAGTDTVILLVHASVSAVTSFAATDPPTPVVATREATTSVHLKAGQTTVIGGLVSQASFDLESKVPILGDIPILGYLFRSTSTQKSKTVLEFHITPVILTGPRGNRPIGLGGER
jgi:hypothetical protein